MPRLTTTKPSYVLQKPLGNGVFLVRRAPDGELFLAQPLDGDDGDNNSNANNNEPAIQEPTSNIPQATFRELLRRGAGHAAANVLNHENLVSVRDELVDFPFPLPLPHVPPQTTLLHKDVDMDVDGRQPQAAGNNNGEQEEDDNARPEHQAPPPPPRRMLLWDYCDAGTLQDVMDCALPPLAAYDDPLGQDFLPEGFVWHVMLGLLRALQFLHQGIREGYEIEEVPAGDGGGGRRWKRARGAQTKEEDWMPILHRDLQPRNVFLQRPRGIETYGAVKLGGFGNCFVSGTVAGTAGTPLVAIKERDGSLAELREKLGRFRRDEKQMPLEERPYTNGSELAALGLMIYQMIHRRLMLLPPGARGNIFDPCSDDVDPQKIFNPDSRYTHELKELVTDLLLSNQNESFPAGKVLNRAWAGFEKWVASRDDGRLHRDLFDDIAFRRRNQERIEKAQAKEGYVGGEDVLVV